MRLAEQETVEVGRSCTGFVGQFRLSQAVRVTSGFDALGDQPKSSARTCSHFYGANRNNQCRRDASRLAVLSRSNKPQVQIPGGSVIANRFEEFLEQLLELKKNTQLGEDKLTFADYVSLLVGRLKQNDWKPLNIQFLAEQVLNVEIP